MASQEGLLSLMRYYLWSNQMNVHLRQYTGKDNAAKSFVATDYVFLQLYMSLWCASLYVVIEGWGRLNLHDSAVDVLLASPNVALLKKFRNGVFHYQNAVFHEKLKALAERTDVSDWVVKLHEELGRCIPEFLQK